MTDQQFDARLKQIEQQAAVLRERADAYRDQELARLFVECEWTQEQIARHIGKTRRWVSYRLLFGTFLSWLGTSGSQTGKPPESLTERRFRTCWSKTKGKEQERFRQVLLMLDETTQPPGYKNLVNKPGIQAAVQALLSDGSWHNIRQIQEAVRESIPDLPSSAITPALVRLQKRPPKGCYIEAKHCGRLHQYRMRKGMPPDDENNSRVMAQIVDKIGPIIEELKQWGRANEYEMSPGAIKRIAVQIERLFAPLLSRVES